MFKVTLFLFLFFGDVVAVQRFPMEAPSIPPKFYAVNSKNDDYDDYHHTLEMWTKNVVRQQNEENQRFQEAMQLQRQPFSDNLFNPLNGRFNRNPVLDWRNEPRKVPLLNPYQNNRPMDIDFQQLNAPVPLPSLPSLDQNVPLRRPMTKDGKAVTMDQISPKPLLLHGWNGPDMIDGFNFKALKSLQ
ncbi:unnamed protein product [Bursaphelenchus okinawaensis]|uniref:Uncharacterized protein n=1 Tax=Bursaphelenchus okinawaensis TaxID=465554 RepID=A0A811JU50_9BILA|nr:unnamed protein product [Bursaphelenchus okinawaensis]CAG9083920.1 unnamed protein product [Bursaphelenchus okinawaensis]